MEGLGEVNIISDLTEKQMHELSTYLKNYGIDIVDNLKSTLVQKTKDVIREMIY